MDSSDNIYKKIGEKIKQARIKKGIGQKVLAYAVKKTSVAISNYEKGIRQISLIDLEKISAELHEPMDYFIDNGNPKSQLPSLLKKTNLFVTSITKCIHKKPFSMPKFYAAFTGQMCALFDLELIAIFNVDSVIGKLNIDAYSMKYELKDKFNKTTGLDIIAKDLRINLENKTITSIINNKILLVDKETLSAFINELIPQLNLLIPIHEKIFDSTNWIFLPVLNSSDNLSKIICINIGKNKADGEKIELLKLVNQYFTMLFQQFKKN